MNTLPNNYFDAKTINKILKIIFVIYSVILLSYSLFFKDPNITGDGVEYLGMTVSFHNHLTPDLNKEDIAIRNYVETKNNYSYPEGMTYYGYFKSLSGAYYSYHFWAYSLLNKHAFTFLHYLGSNELRSFQITNSLLLIFSLLIIIQYFPFNGIQKLWFSYFPPSIPFYFMFHGHIQRFFLILLLL